MKRTPLLIAIEQLLHFSNKPNCEDLAKQFNCSVISVRRELRNVQDTLASIEHRRIVEGRAA